MDADVIAVYGMSSWFDAGSWFALVVRCWNAVLAGSPLLVTYWIWHLLCVSWHLCWQIDGFSLKSGFPSLQVHPVLYSQWWDQSKQISRTEYSRPFLACGIFAWSNVSGRAWSGLSKQSSLNQTKGLNNYAQFECVIYSRKIHGYLAIV